MSDAKARPKVMDPPTLVPELYEAPPRVPVPMKREDEPPGFFDRPEVVRRLQRGFMVVLGLLILADALPLYHYHEHLGMEWFPGFYTAFSFVACLVLFAISKTAAAFLKRGEDYYE